MDESMNAFHGNLAKSSDTLWSDGTFEATAGVTVHTSYSFMGVPWFPSSTYSAHTLPGGEMEGALVGGQEVTVKGVNFVPRVSRVFYNDEEIAYEHDLGVVMPQATATAE